MFLFLLSPDGYPEAGEGGEPALLHVGQVEHQGRHTVT